MIILFIIKMMMMMMMMMMITKMRQRLLRPIKCSVNIGMTMLLAMKYSAINGLLRGIHGKANGKTTVDLQSYLHQSS